jgi:hypothetical protein
MRPETGKRRPPSTKACGISIPRLLPVLAALGVLAWAAWWLRTAGPQGMGLPGCPFHRLTGLACPGCGLTRASFAVLHGRFGEAFRLNPLGFLLLPVAMTGVALETTAWVRQNPESPRLKVGARGAKAILTLLLIYWIVRNLPGWPFPLP